MIEHIKIGPSGWRAVFLKDLTANRFEAILKAMISVFGNQKTLIGFDNRFLSRSLAGHAQKILQAGGWKTELAADIFSTPGVARLVREKKAHWGLVITASHNPYFYNGMKILDAQGCLVNPDWLKKIEDKANEIFPNISSNFDPTYQGLAQATLQGWTKDYFATLLKFVQVSAIKKAHLKVAWDGFGGTSSKLFPALLNQLQVNHQGVSFTEDPTFGGRKLEPDASSTKALMQLVKKKKCQAGLVTDLDGDRFAVIDDKGRYISNNNMGSLMLWYLLKCRGERGTVFQTVSCSARNKIICAQFNVSLEEVPVGFQVMGQRMKMEGGLLGIEETGGLAYGPHLAFKDGLMAHLLVLEMMATQKKKLTELLKILNQYGRFFYHRWDMKVESQKRRAEWQDPAFWEKSLQLKLKELITIDGQKMIFEDDSWLLLRSSKTEPLFRIYAEGRSRQFGQQVDRALKVS